MPEIVKLPENDNLAGALNLNILFEIFRWMEPADLIRLSSVSHFYYNYLIHNEALWKGLNLLYFSHESHDNDSKQLEAKPKPSNFWESWKKINFFNCFIPPKSPKTTELKKFKQQWHKKIYISGVGSRDSNLLLKKRGRIIQNLIGKAGQGKVQDLKQFFKNYPEFINHLTDNEVMLFLRACGTDSESILSFVFQYPAFFDKMERINQIRLNEIPWYMSKIKNGQLFDYLKQWHFSTPCGSVNRASDRGELLELIFSKINPIAFEAISKECLLWFAKESSNSELLAYYVSSDFYDEKINVFSNKYPPLKTKEIFECVMNLGNEKNMIRLLNHKDFFSIFMLSGRFNSELIKLEGNLLSIAILNIERFYNKYNYDPKRLQYAYWIPKDIPKDLPAIYQKLMSHFTDKTYELLSLEALRKLESYAEDKVKQVITELINSKINLQDNHNHDYMSPGFIL